jgi:hypothetical protein
MSENGSSDSFREGTLAQKQRASFGYLHRKAVSAHNEGDGLLASHLALVALNEATSLLKSKNCHLSLHELRWAYIFAHYWLIDGYLLDQDIKQALEHAPQTTDMDKRLLDLLKVYNDLIREPLWSDHNRFSSLQTVRLDWMADEPAPEDLAVLEHLIELLWWRGPQEECWENVRKAWATASSVPSKCKNLLEHLGHRLRFQSSLTAPGSLYPPLDAEGATRWGGEFPNLELWTLNLLGNHAALDAAVTRHLAFVSDDPALVRQLLDFQQMNYFHPKDLDPQAVRLTRRRLFDNPRLRFDEAREQVLSGALGAIFQKDEKGQAYLRFSAIRLGMLCEISALRLWDYGMWLDAIRAQSSAALELCRWGEGYVGFAAHGLKLAVLSLSYTPPRKRIQQGLDALEFANEGVREDLVRSILLSYPLQAYDVLSLLNGLSDVIPADLWVETANWCRRYSDEDWSTKSHGSRLLPFEFWREIFQVLGSGSLVWSKLAPLVLAEARNPLNWDARNRKFFVNYMIYAPVELAKAAASALIDLTVADPAFADDKFRLLCQTCQRRKDLQGELLPGLARIAQTPFQKWRVTKLSDREPPANEERVVKDEMRRSIADFIKRISPGGTPQHPPQIDWERLSLLRWTEQDADWLPLLLQTIESPSTARSGIPAALYVLETIVANGPTQFAEQVRHSFVSWLHSLPVWREDDHNPPGGPLSVVNFEQSYERGVENALASLAYQLRIRLGVDLDDDISRWALDASVKFETTPIFTLTRLIPSLASSMRIGIAPSVESDRANLIRRGELLDACRATLFSLWQRYRENPSTAYELFCGLDGIYVALEKGKNAEPPEWGRANPEVVSALVVKTTPILCQLATCPHADVRAAVARVVRGFASRTAISTDLQSVLTKLGSDARALVRHAALGELET